MQADIKWNAEKEEWLKLERGLSFELVVEAILANLVIDDYPHHNPNRPNQRILVVKLNDRHVAVPYVPEGESKFLKTMYVSRDLDARYGGLDAKTHH